jgi:hypothetical protein
MPLPTADQVEQIIKGLERGLTDKTIAASIKGLKAIDIYNYRHANGITAQIILETRHANWMRMIEKGWALEQIGQLYGVKPRSIRQLLNKKYGYKYSEARKRKKADEAKSATNPASLLDW